MTTHIEQNMLAVIREASGEEVVQVTAVHGDLLVSYRILRNGAYYAMGAAAFLARFVRLPTPDDLACVASSELAAWSLEMVGHYESETDDSLRDDVAEMNRMHFCTVDPAGRDRDDPDFDPAC